MLVTSPRSFVATSAFSFDPREVFDMIPFVGSDSTGQPDISGTSHWVDFSLGCATSAIFPPHRNHPPNTYGVLIWRDTQDGTHRAIGTFSNKTEWRNTTKEDRPPAVGLVTNRNLDGTPPYVGLAVKFQHNSDNQISFPSETHSIVLAFRTAEVSISYWILPESEKTKLSGLLRPNEVPDGEIFEIMFHVQTPRIRSSGVTWPFSVYPGLPTMGQSLLRDANFGQTQNLRFLVKNFEFLHRQLSNNSHAFSLLRVPETLATSPTNPTDMIDTFLWEIDSAIVDIKGSVNDFSLGTTSPRNLAFIHCGIHILHKFVANRSMPGVRIVIRTLNAEQAVLWQTALKLPQNLALANVRVGTPDSIPRTSGDFELWDSVVAQCHEPRLAWEFFRLNVAAGPMRGLSGAIFLADRGLAEVRPKHLCLGQLFSRRYGGN